MKMMMTVAVAGGVCLAGIMAAFSAPPASNAFDAEIARQEPRRREPEPRPEPPVQDRFAQRPVELRLQRRLGAPIERHDVEREGGHARAYHRPRIGSIEKFELDDGLIFLLYHIEDAVIIRS